jgi:hypothetical protein
LTRTDLGVLTGFPTSLNLLVVSRTFLPTSYKGVTAKVDLVALPLQLMMKSFSKTASGSSCFVRVRTSSVPTIIFPAPWNQIYSALITIDWLLGMIKVPLTSRLVSLFVTQLTTTLQEAGIITESPSFGTSLNWPTHIFLLHHIRLVDSYSTTSSTTGGGARLWIP